MSLEIDHEIQRIVSQLLKSQCEDGSWDFPFETGIATDAYTIILLRSLEINDEPTIQSIVNRILSFQETDGSWKLFKDQPDGDLSSTILAYFALLFSGSIDEADPRLQYAKRFILQKGGIEKAETFTKILLAICGQYDWTSILPLPIELLLLPPKSPIHFYDISVFGRANLAPVIVLQQMKYQLKTPSTPDMTGLYTDSPAQPDIRTDSRWKNVLTNLSTYMKNVQGVPKEWKKKGLRAAEHYMLNRIEPDGTLLSYFSSTFFMIFALLSLGYPKSHPVIMHAITGIFKMACRIDNKIHIQYTTANVWNTSLISYVLQEAGLPYTTPTILKANQYLLKKQHFKYGDWSVHAPNATPGGWGFSHINTINPDVDDTTASLRAIRTMISENPLYQQSWKSGLQWVLFMQNDDGGWPSFEKGVDKKWLSLIPVQGAQYLLLDPSTADLTGRTLEFLGNFTNLNKRHPAMKRGIQWLEDQQREDGSWYGRWGICYLYGTWAALTGLSACGWVVGDRNIDKAVKWLHSIQNEDGGWGESCRSDCEGRYIPLGKSTLTHTAWALDALISVSDTATPAIRRGVRFLLENGGQTNWTIQYPKGQGMASGFYIHYHSYQYVWPLLALSHYKEKFHHQ